MRSHATQTAWLIGAMALATYPAAAAAAATVEVTGPTMGTTYHVKVNQLPAGLTQAQLNIGIDQQVSEVDRLMSTWRDDSQVSRFNRSTSTDWFAVSAPTATVVAAALEVSRISDGAFDVTVGPLVNLWHFGPDRTADRVPTDAEVERAKVRVGYDMLDVRLDPPALRKRRGDVAIDLSAIAKGYAVDRVAAFLENSGIVSYMVEIGGEVRTRGARGDGGPWRVGIETPTVDRRGIQQVVALADRAMATSGDYRNYFEQGGKRYSHTIDPRTGRPIEHALASVSVAADDCMTADAWATALMVLGPKRGFELATSRGMAVYFIVHAGDAFEVKSTPTFDQLAWSAPAAPGEQRAADEASPSSGTTKLFIAVLVIFALALMTIAIGVIVRRRAVRMRDERT